MKKLFKILFVNILVVFIVLVIVDPFLGSDIPEDVKTKRSLGLREYGPDRVINLSPEGHGIDVNKLDSKNYLIETNNSGFIIGPRQDRSRKCDILFFGGSTTECAFVDDSLRFPYLVGKKLDYVTGNAGYGGNHSFHSLINFLGKGLTEKPEIVVWMHNINDLVLLTKTGSYFEAPSNRNVLNERTKESLPKFSIRVKKMLVSIVDAAIPNLYRRIYVLSNTSNKNIGTIDEWDGFRNNEMPDFEIVKLEFRKSLESFIGIAKSNDIRLVLMTQFNRFNLLDKEIREEFEEQKVNMTYDKMVDYYSQFNQIIRDVAEENNIMLIDLDIIVPSTSKLLYDAVHLNNNGSIMVSEIIASELGPLLGYNNLYITDSLIVD